MARNLRDVLELSVAGVSMLSMAACGSANSLTFNDTDKVQDLCLRWFQLSAYMPAMHSFYEDPEKSRLPTLYD